ncbi:class I SAM-dependent DNA methyltransferase [Jatrophihabitans fulvus]
MTDWFAGSVAAQYDAGEDEEFDPAVVNRTVDVLADLARGGPVLEFAIGTGRIAVPLQGRGVPVTGIELSPDMIAQLRAKSADIGVVEGDMTSARADGTYSLVCLVFNTIANVTTQDGQVDVFRNAARHLAEGGRFVVEVFVPALQKLPPGDRFVPFDVTSGHVGIDEYDVTTQAMWSHHVTPGGPLLSMPFRYAWPAELDLMARIAGLRFEHRWAGWDRAPFTATSTKHVSVWRAAP